MFSNQQIQNNWPKIKSLILSHWNKLSVTEVEATHGNLNSLGKLVQKNYGVDVNFEKEYEKICENSNNLSTTVNSSEMEMTEKSMDKDRDDQYLVGPNGVTRPLAEKIPKKDTLRNETIGEDGFNESSVDGFNNLDRHSADYSGLNNKIELNQQINNQTKPDELQNNQVPSPKGKDITLGRSNSSANTTSHSALSSSGNVERH